MATTTDDADGTGISCRTAGPDGPDRGAAWTVVLARGAGDRSPAGKAVR